MVAASVRSGSIKVVLPTSLVYACSVYYFFLLAGSKSKVFLCFSCNTCSSQHVPLQREPSHPTQQRALTKKQHTGIYESAENLLGRFLCFAVVLPSFFALFLCLDIKLKIVFGVCTMSTPRTTTHHQAFIKSTRPHVVCVSTSAGQASRSMMDMLVDRRSGQNGEPRTGVVADAHREYQDERWDSMFLWPLCFQARVVFFLGIAPQVRSLVCVFLYFFRYFSTL